MRKIYLSLITLAAASVTVPAAAQLPNADFAKWVECIPWTSDGNTKAIGTTPENWTISNVIGLAGNGATAVGGEAVGIDGGKAVKVANTSNSLLESQIVPGYFTLGTTWSTSVMGQNNDGGTFGGIKLTTRPDGVYFNYKRSVSEGSEQMATVVAYLWTGTFTQKDVPGNIVALGSPKTVDMVNRDRNILGMETAKGGEVTKTEGAELIAKAIRPIATVTDDWTSITIPLEYTSEADPEMFNVIFAANDYFTADKIDKGNSFTIAEPKLVYWSKLSDLTIGGQTIEGFSDAVYTYHVDALPEVSNVSGSVMGASAKAVITEKDDEIVITVTNPDGTDEEGLSEHIYVLTTKDVPATGNTLSYTGKLTVEMGGSDITDGGVEATVNITPNEDGTCTFLLPNLSLGDMGQLGDIKLEGVKSVEEDGITTYTGKKENMKLQGGEITADVSLNGTVDAEGKANMIIDVLWKSDVLGEIPIKVTFVGQGKAGIGSVEIDNSNAPVEYFDIRGVRVNPDALAPGLYIRRQGSDVSKILVR